MAEERDLLDAAAEVGVQTTLRVAIEALSDEVVSFAHSGRDPQYVRGVAYAVTVLKDVLANRVVAHGDARTVKEDS